MKTEQFGKIRKIKLEKYLTYLSNLSYLST